MTPRGWALLQCTLGIGALCVMDALVKLLSLRHPVELVTLMRFATGGLLALAVWRAKGAPPIRRDMWGPHLLRGAIGAALALAFFWGITQVPLAEAITIVFIAPLMVPLMARLILGEALHPRALLAGAIGFAGVLVSVQGAPDAGPTRIWAIAALLFSAVAYAVSVIILRARAGKDGAVSITLLANLVPAVLLSPVVLGHDASWIDDLGWFLLVGILSNIGVHLLARAYVHLEAQTSAAMEFTALPWAALVGYVFLAEAVRPQIWAGAALIFAGVWLVSRPISADRRSSP
ncbi:DMT family transporter [Polymorphobacter sp.]|uniref:DMT family transporter n=1 Tax=Polymorphobacter sp. TaxID=1909290 RepID=UPI003F7077D2